MYFKTTEGRANKESCIIFVAMRNDIVVFLREEVSYGYTYYRKEKIYLRGLS